MDANILNTILLLLANTLIGFMLHTIKGFERRIENVEKQFHEHASNFAIHGVHK